MKEKIQNYIIIVLAGILFFLLIILCFTYKNNKDKNNVIMTNQLTDSKITFEQGISNDVLEPIVNGQVVQKITIKDLNINCIGIKFATYDRVNNAIYRLLLKENDKYIVKYDFNTNVLANGKYTYFKFKTVHLDNKKEYSIVIEPINISEGNIITIFSNKDTNDITYSLYN